jgi:radical SAM family uncharacterized protein/radical SAM-linked protein
VTTAETTVHEHPYAEFIHKIEKPVRYLGGEHGAVRKPWESVRARVALAFPDLYDIGMSHLGFKILYGILNEHPATLAERAYAPWKDMEDELRARDLPLVSLESARPLCDFDVVGFSLQFELTYTNVLLMLDLGRIPLRSANRTDAHPLVIAGGPTATHGEPLAPFVDAFVIGDGEEVSVQIALAWAAFRDAKMPRAQRLRELAKIPGVYVPSLYATAVDPVGGFEVIDCPLVPEAPARIARAHVPDINKYPFPSGGPVAATETVFDRVSVEIARGCTEGCRFCQAGMIYRPVRERTPEAIVDTIVSAVKSGGYDEASLTSLSTADYSCIAPLVKKVMERLEGEKVSLSVSSLRAYGLGEELLDEIQKVRATGLTFAPEAGTQRMRDVVNKNVTEAQLMETAERVFSRGWSKMKLYFMIGLPTEQDEDVEGIVETGRKARDVGRKVSKGRPPTVTVSVSTHVPKPHTPFQWCAMDTLEEIWRKQALLRQKARELRVDLRMHESHGSTIEGILARGDRRLGDVIEHAYKRGARFDSWEERLAWDAWQEAFRVHGVSERKYLGTIPVDARLPWDHIDVGLEDGFLLREYRKALANRLSPPCGKAVGMNVHHTNLEDARADKRKLVCYDCGVACDLTHMREERIVFLSRLGATKRPERKSEPVRMSPEERRPKANFKQGEPRRYRIAFTRTGRAAYQGHLDLIRLVPRVFRRAEIEMYYSQGFHPKPEMIFGPALALGIATLDEYVDVKLAGEVDVATLPALLQPGAPEGLTFVRAVKLEKDDPAISKVVEATEYVAALPWGALRERGLGSAEQVVAAVEAKRAAGLSVLRRSEGLGRKVDVGAFLERLEVGSGDESIAAAGYAGELLPLRFMTRVTANGTCKPSEVVAALFGEEMPARFIRTAQGRMMDGTWATPMDLARLRALEPARRERAAAVDAGGESEANETGAMQTAGA